MSTHLSRRCFLAGSSALMSLGIPTLARSMTTRPRLSIPTLIDGTNAEPVDLHIRQGAWSFMPDVMTPTLGINQDYLGPTIRTRKNSELNLRYRNGLAEGVAIHGHGLHVPGDVDGGPQSEMLPGGEWQPSLSIIQPAATCWYHAHSHGRTGHQVYHGLAGMLIIDDDDADRLPLPRHYGVDDLPVIIQDRTFDSRGRLVYSLHDVGEDGWFGDTVVINGSIAPVTRVPAGKVRLRILNGANARFYVIAFADNRTFHKIATDGGLLEAPVPMTTMEMSPGERCEIVVDLSDGRSAELLTFFEDDIDEAEDGTFSGLLNLLNMAQTPEAGGSLTLEVDPALTAQTAPLPDRMTTIFWPREDDITRTRDFLLTMNHKGEASDHGAMDMAINGAVMDMRVINERVGRGVWERWRVRSDLGAHPFHVHGCSFLIEKMEGTVAPPDQRGYKDMVVLDDDDWSTFVVRFDHLASEQFPYMYHCHILEHEDRGMMGQFTVT